MTSLGCLFGVFLRTVQHPQRCRAEGPHLSLLKAIPGCKSVACRRRGGAEGRIGRCNPGGQIPEVLTSVLLPFWAE